MATGLRGVEGMLLQDLHERAETIPERWTDTRLVLPWTVFKGTAQTLMAHFRPQGEHNQGRGVRLGQCLGKEHGEYT